MRDAISKAQDQLARMFACRRCGKPKVEMATGWRSRSTGSGETLHLATDFAGDLSTVCTCPPEGVEPGAWPCPGCGAYVSHQAAQCGLCGYARATCPVCQGAGVTDPPPPVVDFRNGCDFCGHLRCKGCCWKCDNPACGFNVAGECPDCQAAPAPCGCEGGYLYPAPQGVTR